jgi:hypothetical protein
MVLANFNEQMEKLYELLKAVESVNLAPSVLEPEPVVIGANGTNYGGGARGPGGPDGQGAWANSQSGGFRNEENQVQITIGDEDAAGKGEKAKEQPLWMTESTVNRTGDYTDASSVPAASSISTMVADDEEGGDVQNDEITSLLLRHERRNNAGDDKKQFIPGKQLIYKSQPKDS